MLDSIKSCTRFVPLRLPRDLHAEVEVRAAAMGRTVTMEVVELVRAALETENLEKGPEAGGERSCASLPAAPRPRERPSAVQAPRDHGDRGAGADWVGGSREKPRGTAATCAALTSMRQPESLAQRPSRGARVKLNARVDRVIR